MVGSDPKFNLPLEYLRNYHSSFANPVSPLSPFDRTTIFIATDLLCRSVGERMSPVTEYGTAIGVGVGTVQKALRALTDIGAVTLQPRGHLGTTILDLSVGALWHAARLEPISFAIGPQENPEFLGLEHGLQAAFDKIGIMTVFRRQRGSDKRAEMVHNQEVDCAIFSRKAGEYFAGSTLSFDLPRQTYYRNGGISVLFSPDADEGSELRVGIDRSSIDHQFLTHLFFDQNAANIRLVECPYSHSITAILTGHIHAAVWGHITLGLPLEVLPLSRKSLPPQIEKQVDEELSSARILYSSAAPLLTNVLSAIDIELVQAKQTATVDEMIERQQRLTAYLPHDGLERGLT